MFRFLTPVAFATLILPCCYAQVGGAGGLIVDGPRGVITGIIGGRLPNSPTGWKAGYSYTQADARPMSVSLDPTVRHSGTWSARLQIDPLPKKAERVLEPQMQFTQRIKANAYRGRRVRLSAWLLTNGDAGMSISAEGPSTTRLSRNVERSRSKSDPNNWAQYELTIDVPGDAIGIEILFTFRQSGQLWIDDVQLDSVGPRIGDRVITIPLEHVPGIHRRYWDASWELVNPDFEKK